jgi:acetyltransferase-like isoleucine patch superfamily enzyme
MLRRRIKSVLGPALWLRLKDLLYRPSGVVMGPRSYIFRPHAIHPRQSLTLGAGCEILKDSYIWSPDAGTAQIRIGDGTYIGRHLYLTAMDRVTIGAGCVISDHVYITDLAHGLDPHGAFLLHQPLESKGPVAIGDGCFLGFRASILPGVTLGAHCVVGTNAVVTRSFPEYTMLVGIPARAIKTYSLEQKQWIPIENIEPKL